MKEFVLHLLLLFNLGVLILVSYNMGRKQGIKAILNNRNFIGIELNEEYFKIAEKRINDAIVEQESELF